MIAIDDEGVITMVNDGAGIDVAMHPEHNVYIPELIFGNMLTSTNYDEGEEKILGNCPGKTRPRTRLASVTAKYPSFR